MLWGHQIELAGCWMIDGDGGELPSRYYHCVVSFAE